MSNRRKVRFNLEICFSGDSCGTGAEEPYICLEFLKMVTSKAINEGAKSSIEVEVDGQILNLHEAAITLKLGCDNEDGERLISKACLSV